MSAERFSLDANVLVYGFDRSAGDKRERALLVVNRASQADCVLTVQALAEFFVVVTRKNMVAATEAQRQVADWITEFPTASAGGDALKWAMTAATRDRLGFWDAMLLATAREAGCAVVLSEDMQDGAKFGGVTVRNPFAGASLPKNVRDLLGLA